MVYLGKSRAGKDSVANIILNLDNKFSKYSLASPIKKLMNELFDWDERHADGELKEVVDPYWGISPRMVYQTFGTDFARNMIHTDIWVMKAYKEFEKRKYIIIPDIRFPNELEILIKNNKNAILIHVDRPDMKEITENAHISEQYTEIMKNNANFIITNNGTLGDLEVQIKEKLGNIFKIQ